MNSSTKSLLALLVALCLGPLSAVTAQPGPEKICGTSLLRSRRPPIPEAKIRAALAAHAQVKTVHASYSVGDKKTFKVYNFATNGFDDLVAVYRGGGSSCHVFVPDAYWKTTLFGGKDPNSVVAQVVSQFEGSILTLIRNWIGQEPNPGIDGDPKVYLLITDILDGMGFGGGYVAGFFNSEDQLKSSGTSNGLDILYMDLNPGTVGDAGWYGTMAHEFSHLVHFVQGAGEETRWVDEGTSTLVDYMYTGETPDPQVKNFVANPNLALVEDSADYWFGQNPFPYYGEALLFMLYMKNRIGGTTLANQQAFVRKLVAEDLKGKKGVEAATGMSLGNLFTDWSVANALNLQTVGGGIYYYQEDYDASSKNNLGLPVQPQQKNINVTGSLNVTASVVNWGNRYYEYLGTGDLDLTFQGSDANAPYVVTLVSVAANGSVTVQDVSLDSSKKASIKVSGLGTSISRALVRVTVNKEMSGDTGNQDYTFSLLASGVPTSQEGTLVPILNPGLKSSINLVARLNDGFATTPGVVVTVNGAATTLTMRKISDSLYQGGFTFPAGYTGQYTAVLTGKNTKSGSAISNSFTFSHSFK